MEFLLVVQENFHFLAKDLLPWVGMQQLCEVRYAILVPCPRAAMLTTGPNLMHFHLQLAWLDPGMVGPGIGNRKDARNCSPFIVPRDTPASGMVACACDW